MDNVEEEIETFCKEVLTEYNDTVEKLKQNKAFTSEVERVKRIYSVQELYRMAKNGKTTVETIEKRDLKEIDLDFFVKIMLKCVLAISVYEKVPKADQKVSCPAKESKTQTSKVKQHSGKGGMNL